MGKIVYLPVSNQWAVPASLVTSAYIWVRTIGDRALLPMLIGMAFLMLLAYTGVSVVWFWLAAACWFALLMTIPMAAVLVFVPRETWVERRTREREQARARAELAAFGLTPEQYINTIPRNQYLRRWKAADRFGVDAT